MSSLNLPVFMIKKVTEKMKSVAATETEKRSNKEIEKC